MRIYLSMIGLMLLAFLGTGVSAYLNFRKQEVAYNAARLSRKEVAVQESMRYYLEQMEAPVGPESIGTYFAKKIDELSDVHNLAINLYNLRGELLLSSSPENIEKLGFSQKIDYTILKQLSTGNARAEIARDIDYGTFVMAYWYFRDNKGRPLAITNVRYDKQEIDRAELTAFIETLSITYLLLFAGASIVAYLLSNSITSSLQRIGRFMQQSDLERGLVPITWEANDEIGTLVDAYNGMLVALEHAAEKLARSERESAWREMAKQVAHEIKNPLTPMKLRVQHLQRSLDPKDPEFASKLEAFVGAMIEQIQSLATIAGEFSDFAKMPRAVEEEIELGSLVRNAVELYKGEAGDQINFASTLGEEAAWIMADKEQVLRVLNNLITNAFQAVPEEKSAQVVVTLHATAKEVCFEVLDNGKGIPEEMKEKIFVPSFTTKSTGAGLGLAIVKNIVSEAGGHIGFESIEGRGTRFKVCLPRIRPAGRTKDTAQADSD